MEQPRIVAEKDQTVCAHAERISSHIDGMRITTGDNVRAVMEAVLADSQIATEFAGAAIRHKSMCGRVARQILRQIGEDPNQINVLAIGDITVPEFARGTVEGFLQKAHNLHMLSVADGETGYDLAAKGSERARRAVMELFDRHYNFSAVPGLRERFTENACLVHGGMTALDFIAAGHMTNTAQNGFVPIFVSPDTSFSTWPSIVQRRIVNGKNIRDFKGRITGSSGIADEIATEQKNALNITPEQVEAYYAGLDCRGRSNCLWYMTPVGNPTGAKIPPKQLKEVCEAIVKNDPSSTILLDCVYVRTLDPEEAQELMQGVLQNPDIRNRVIIIESFSKTHGICGERAGVFFAENKKLFVPAQNEMMVISAGINRYVDSLVQAIAEAAPEENAVIAQMHKFWADEKRGLFAHLIQSGKFHHLFHEDQSHIDPESLVRPCGLYLFLRLQNGVTDKDVVLATGCYGVQMNMQSGSYIRFSVGKITEPIYSKIGST